MTRTPASLLLSGSGNPSPPPLPPPLPLVHGHTAGEQQAISVDSNTVVILVSLLCALICVAGLALVARCTCRRAGGGSSSSGSSVGAAQAQQPPRGLKKAAIESLPTMAMSLEGRDDERGECAICLGLFAEGDELRVLPHCSHGFHAPCIDTWLAAHASCPSCRAAVAVVTCRRCGAACAGGDLDAPPAAAAVR